MSIYTIKSTLFELELIAANTGFYKLLQRYYFHLTIQTCPKKRPFF